MGVIAIFSKGIFSALSVCLVLTFVPDCNQSRTSKEKRKRRRKGLLFRLDVGNKRQEQVAVFLLFPLFLLSFFCPPSTLGFYMDGVFCRDLLLLLLLIRICLCLSVVVCLLMIAFVVVLVVGLADAGASHRESGMVIWNTNRCCCCCFFFPSLSSFP